MGRVNKINKSNIWVDYKFILDNKALEATKYEIIISKILQDSDKLYSDLGGIRKIIKLGKPLNYPEIASEHILLSLIKKLDLTFQTKLSSSTQFLLKKTGLPLYWELSIQILILTHFFPVPKREPFYLYDPEHDVPLPFIDPHGRPKIIFQSYFTPNEFSVWIKSKEISDKLRLIAKNLPKQFGRNINEQKLAISQIVFFKREFEGKSFEEISNYINDNHADLNINDDSIEAKYSYIDIARLYNRYKKFVEKMYQ
ncbi:hypothetical protein A2130_01865 [Candidatus Woesebacteria bacterium GWC2_33_12]|uniref:Uncharacterized protein n=1 Tax=Candidatus Woesebacteria bacterium GW2011_GWB1_33_22 TaxID=1618566 RepID=A0A0F9ZL57_9BACT|nr:MAG: hypothetical protein UR29_C0003G0006 [Candidatus Woesebacteria bacterium GW2011_GWC2_33_12]KKP42247.1 MAG: hypothetical protein UR33_C0004G0006 [Candidatus Woesebacteria bacterium GW2011_GWA2_33_20]KKP44978.1 MAG: hypothetical protein UR35_C0004G0010 [Candidatus Woesebacteria bacterium GW2011_GWB1_33_22]KKP46827.1 MAG: hypothetical protein UR37_C0004G0006 [Microgenomates group bacterium GW2011_GWC1_33_28]KKP50699.1 MAG: hypothetical protein UR41_C0004G0010 [Candidatus Woesebacteria bact